jgi:hypothetical protein
MAKKNTKDKTVRKLIRVERPAKKKDKKAEKKATVACVDSKVEITPVRMCWLTQPSSTRTYTIRVNCTNCLNAAYLYITKGIPVGQVTKFPNCSTCGCDGLTLSK